MWRRQPGWWWWRQFERDPCPIPHGAVWVGGLGRGSGEDNGPIPSVGTTLPPCAACRFSRAPTEFLQFLVELPSSLRVVGNAHSARPVIVASSVSESKIFTNMFFFFFQNLFFKLIFYFFSCSFFPFNFCLLLHIFFIFVLSFMCFSFLVSPICFAPSLLF